MSVQSSTNVNKQKILMKWLLTILLSIGILLIPVTENFTFSMKVFFAITIFNVFLLAFELTHMIIPALLLPVGYLITHLAPSEVIFQPWSTQLPWLLIGAFIITAVMEETGLSKRIAYWCLYKTGGSFKGMLLGLFLAGIILALVMPGGLSRTILLCTIVMGICKAMGLQSGSKTAAGLFIASYICSASLSVVALTSSSTNLLLVSFVEPYGYKINFIQWFLYIGIPGTIFCMLSMLLIYILFKDKNTVQSKEYVLQEYRKLDKMTYAEKKLMILLVIVVLLLITTPLHKVEPGYIILLAALICFLPKINLASQATTTKVNFVVIILTVSMVSIGNVSMEVGAGNFIAEMMLPAIPDNVTIASLMMYVIIFIGNILLTPLALIAGLLSPFLEIGTQIGMKPIGTAFIFGASAENIILPHEIINSLVVFGFGMIKIKDFIKYFALKSLLFVPLLVIVFIPWFRLMGIL